MDMFARYMLHSSVHSSILIHVSIDCTDIDLHRRNRPIPNAKQHMTIITINDHILQLVSIRFPHVKANESAMRQYAANNMMLATVRQRANLDVRLIADDFPAVEDR